MNNPSSMFGHTFLRFDRAEQDERTRLLSYSVNYGAAVDADNGLQFALYGLTGGYPGTYSVMPYHQLVRKYSDYENRDIWEYQLNLTATEVRRLLEHLWELQSNYADYYFFDENCSYQLLFLLDVARPGLALTDRFEVYAIPVDTVRAVVDQPAARRHGVPGIEPDPDRAAPARPGPARADAGQPARGRGTRRRMRPRCRRCPRRGAPRCLRWPPTLSPIVCAPAGRRAIGRRRLAWRLLAARSQVAAAAAAPPVPEPAVRPDQGHASARAALGIGARDGRLFQSLRRARAITSSWTPRPVTFAGRKSISWTRAAPLRGRLCADPRLVDRRRHPLAVAAQRAVQAAPWRLGGGLERFRTHDEDEKGELVAALWAGAGAAEDLGQAALGSLMLEAELGAGTDCPDACFAALGPALTLVWPATERWKILLAAGVQLLASDHVEPGFDFGLSQSYALGRNFAVELDLLVEDDGAGAQAEWSTSLLWYS